MQACLPTGRLPVVKRKIQELFFRVELLAAGASNDQISKMRSNVSIHIGQDRRFFRAAWPRCAIPNQIRDRVSFLRRIY